MTLFRFAEMMSNVLRNNSHKSGWQSLTAHQCLRRMKQELGELERAVREKKPTREIQEEAVDVCNFAYFLCCNIEADGEEGDE